MSAYNEYHVLKCLRATTEGALTVAEIHAETGIGSTGVRRAVKALIESGDVIALGYSHTNARCYAVKRVKK